jgi:hypothetical protein
LRDSIGEAQSDAIAWAFGESARVLRAAADRARDGGYMTLDVLHEVANHLEQLSPDVGPKPRHPEQTT